MSNNTLEHMIARFRVQTGYKPSAREVFYLAQALKFMGPETAEEQE